MSSISLEIAWTWMCPKCRKRNWVKGSQADEETQEMLRVREGIPDHMTGDFVTQPKDVVCMGCLQKYKVEEPKPPEIDEDEQM